jgi:hypothetical protein
MTIILKGVIYLLYSDLLNFCLAIGWFCNSQMNIFYSAVSHFCCLHQLPIRNISHTHKADVIIFTIVPASRRLIPPLKPMCTNNRMMSRRMLHIITIGYTTLLLVKRLSKPRSHSSSGGTKVKFPNNDWQTCKFVDSFQPILIGGVSINI